MSSWWTSEAVAYTRDDREGHRIRFLIAEKRARVSTRIDGADEFPESLNEINPARQFPILVDKNLVCFGSALDELIHERYPSPSLLPVDPVKRAQVRMLANDVAAHYDTEDLVDFVSEVQESYNESPTLFLAGSSISIIDVALAPLIYEATQFKKFEATGHFRIYVQRLLSRPSFQQSLHSSTPVTPEEDLDEEEAAA